MDTVTIFVGPFAGLVLGCAALVGAWNYFKGFVRER